MKKLTQKRLMEVLRYDPATGVFKWMESGSGRRADLVAGYESPDGYTQIMVDGKNYFAHRLVWFLYHGYFPEHDLDHIDRDKSNNRLDNLREASRQCNVRNTGNRSTNTSGVKGVYWDKRDNKWYAQICISGKNKHLGLYENFDDAVMARYNKEKEVNWSGCDSSSPAYQYLKANNLL